MKRKRKQKDLVLIEQIKKLRSEGVTYKDICEQLQCSEYVISYYTCPGFKERAKNWNKKSRSKHPFLMKCDNFQRRQVNRMKKYETKKYKCNFNRRIWNKISCFHTHRRSKIVEDFNFNYNDVMTKFGENPKCYLTGDFIDIHKTKDYEFDHITPTSQGGKNTLDNLGLATAEANRSKCDLTVEEYLVLCKKVLTHHGYTVVKD